MNCVKCKYFVADKFGSYDHRGVITSLGLCARSEMISDCVDYVEDGTNNWDSTKIELKAGFSKNLMFSMDGSGYKAELLVMPNFGCVEFAEKDES